MSSAQRSFASRPACAMALAAAMVVGLGPTAVHSQAAPEDRVAAAARAAAAGGASSGLVCEGKGQGIVRYTVDRANGGTRAIELCSAGEGRDLSGTARALSAALDSADAAADEAGGPTPSLLSLRLMKARAELDGSAEAAARIRTLDQAIKALQADASDPAK